MEISDLYTQLIIDHQKNPRNYGILEEKDKEVHLTNSSCGDEIFLQVKLVQNKIKDIAFYGHGCAISTASASIMTELVKGESKEKALRLYEEFLEMVRTGKEPSSLLKDARAFQGISLYPLRVKCATLAWHALKEVLTGARAL